MRKILFFMVLLIFSLALCSCSHLQSGHVGLESESCEVTKEQYDYLCKKYNIQNQGKYIVFETYDEYITFYGNVSHKNIDATHQSENKDFFKKNVRLCYAIIAKGEETICHRGYFYWGGEDHLRYWNSLPGHFTGNHEYEETDIKYYFDIVDVPKRIYNKIS